MYVIFPGKLKAEEPSTTFPPALKDNKNPNKQNDKQKNNNSKKNLQNEALLQTAKVQNC